MFPTTEMGAEGGGPLRHTEVQGEPDTGQGRAGLHLPARGHPCPAETHVESCLRESPCTDATRGRVDTAALGARTARDRRPPPEGQPCGRVQRCGSSRAQAPPGG